MQFITVCFVSKQNEIEPLQNTRNSMLVCPRALTVDVVLLVLLLMDGNLP